MSFESGIVDVLIVGAGPVGLLIAYALQRMGISTCVIERYDKANMAMYGRACTLYPRTLEMIDQLGLLDDLTQVGFIGRGSVTFTDRGDRVTRSSIGNIFEHMGATYLDYVLNIRLKYSEDLIKEAYLYLGGQVVPKWEIRDIKRDIGATDDYKVLSKVGATASEEIKEIKSKYIIGADGGSSTVRSLTGITSKTENTTYHWVRIDGIVKTNMPDSELGFGNIESATYGHVLWVNLDHGRSRIGFSLTPDLYQRYGRNMTQAQAIEEAKQAMRPFSVDFETVDWYTVYSIRQSVADHYILDECVILAGDACHIHSSGAAQGMNTGTHDAVNLAWKLGGILKGWYHPEILRTYEDERRPTAQHLIKLDKDFSTLISNDIPDRFKGTSLSAMELFAKLSTENTPFTIGLGINYEESSLINRYPKTGSVRSGWRAPDALLHGPGSKIPTRLQTLTPNLGSYWVIVFAGEPLLTKPKLYSLRTFLDSEASIFRKIAPQIPKFLTIIRGVKSQGEASMGVRSFGKFYYDVDGSAHDRYGMSSNAGGITILRPDGILAFATGLEQGKDVADYFSKVLL